MAKSKNIHTATLPNGETATRTSENRTYTHCVATRANYPRALAVADRLDEQDRKNFDYYLSCHEGRHPHAYSQFTNAGERARWSEIAAFGSRDAYAAHLRQERLAQLEADRLAGNFERWSVLGWNGSERLAMAAANTARSGGYYAEVVILPATVVTK
jgi:hypothetical protein